MPGERAHGACHLASHAMGPISVYIDINIYICYNEVEKRQPLTEKRMKQRSFVKIERGNYAGGALS
jgi:hypothetical protein